MRACIHASTSTHTQPLFLLQSYLRSCPASVVCKHIAHGAPCRAQALVFCISFACETLLVALTVVQLLTASSDPRLHASGAAGDAEQDRLRGDILVTALSFSLTCAAFGVMLVMQVGRLRERVLAGGRVMHACAQRAVSTARRSLHTAPRLLPGSAGGTAADEGGLSQAAVGVLDTEKSLEHAHEQQHAEVEAAALNAVSDSGAISGDEGVSGSVPGARRDSAAVGGWCGEPGVHEDTEVDTGCL